MNAMRERRHHIIQGEFAVSDDPSVVYSTILGSCVAACIIDPIARVGGMNHFLLPGEEGGSAVRHTDGYGAHLMELLVNGLMKLGARRERLEAKLFGGARVVRGLSDIGSKNAQFAERYLQYEGIKMLRSDTGGTSGRRLHFWPVSGRARVSYLEGSIASVETSAANASAKASYGEIELFVSTR